MVASVSRSMHDTDTTAESHVSVAGVASRGRHRNETRFPQGWWWAYVWVGCGRVRRDIIHTKEASAQRWIENQSGCPGTGAGCERAKDY